MKRHGVEIPEFTGPDVPPLPPGAVRLRATVGPAPRGRRRVDVLALRPAGRTAEIEVVTGDATWRSPHPPDVPDGSHLVGMLDIGRWWLRRPSVATLCADIEIESYHPGGYL